MDPETFEFKRFDLITGIITVIVIAVSFKTFVRMWKKMYSYLEKKY
jgi:hypothetical protein